LSRTSVNFKESQTAIGASSACDAYYSVNELRFSVSDATVGQLLWRYRITPTESFATRRSIAPLDWTSWTMGRSS